MAGWHIGVIGGSGLYEGATLDDAEQIPVASAFGEPSGPVTTGSLEGVRMTFIARHGEGHRLGPGQVNYRANIDVLKRCGVTDVLAISAVGSLKEEIAPGDFVAVNQFIDRTKGRPSSFFGEGMVAHVSMADPICPRLSALAAASARAAGADVSDTGTYLAMEGPQFSTLAESRLYRSWGCDVIGMTNMPEAKLAREAELCYATVAMVTDFDSWHEDHGTVDITKIVAVMHANADKAKALVGALAKDFPREHEACPIGSDKALEYAIITAPEKRDPALLAKLDAVAGRVLKR